MCIRTDFRWLACTAQEHFAAVYSGVSGDGSIWADFSDGASASEFLVWCEARGWRPRHSTLHADRNRILVLH